MIEDELRWQCLERENASKEATDRLAEAKRLTEKVKAEREAKRLQLVAEKREQQDRYCMSNSYKDIFNMF